MRPIGLKEGQWSEDAHELTYSQVAALRASELLLLKEAGPGKYLLRSKRKIGQVRLGDGPDAVELHIAPKIPIGRLLFLVGYAMSRGRWREGEVDAGDVADLVPVVAEAFARAAHRALTQGMLLGYEEREDTLAMVRGRIRDADQVRVHYGMPLPVEVRYDDSTPDIPENRLLLAATDRLLSLSFPPTLTAEAGKQRADLLHRLRRIKDRLVGVGLLRAVDPIPAWTPSRLNARFHTALRLAELVLRGGSYEFDDGSRVRVDGLLVDMEDVFEDFTCVALKQAFDAGHGGSCHAQDRGRLDEEELVEIIPDLVYKRLGPDGEPHPVAVFDAKYKARKGPKGENDDIFQMVSYCAALNTRRGYLVFAQGIDGVTKHTVATIGVTIVQHPLDLTQPPDRLLAEIAKLAADAVAT